MVSVRSDEQALQQPALCLEWAVPVGGLTPLSTGAGEGAGGRLRRLLRGGPDTGQDAPPEVYAEAERLATSIARIAAPGLRATWLKPGAPARSGEIHLDPRLLAPRRRWDLPHRVDALMGLTLRDAAHAVRTPPGYRRALVEQALAVGVLTLPDGATTVPDDTAAPLVALFLLVELAHVSAWLREHLPGFRGYQEALWLWRLPHEQVAARLQALRDRPTFGAIMDALVALLAGRADLSSVPLATRPLVQNVHTTITEGVDAQSSPEQRYALALALYQLLNTKVSDQPREERRQSTGSNSEPGPDPTPAAEELADAASPDRQAALEALAAIAGNSLDPQEQRDGLTPDALADAQRQDAATSGAHGAGPGPAPDEEESELVVHRHLRLQHARPMRLITPPISADVEVRYRGSYTVVRGQADALRQALKFRLAERRHALRGQYSGQLDEQALYRLAGADEAIFQRRTVESAPDQDLCILLDESASMGAGQRHARATAVLFHHALRGLPGVRHWIFGFSGYGRAIALYRYISPSRADLQRPQRLGAVRSREATPLAEAVAGAAEAMLTEGQGAQKLMIVVTDGQPDDVEGTRRALRAAESRGVAILALGIAADAAATGDLFSHFTLYEDVASLPRKVGAILRRVVGASG